MFLTKDKKIPDHILETLQRGPAPSLDLVELIKKQIPGVTKQAVYAALRLLNRQEVVTTSKGVCALNLNWIKEVNRYTIETQKHYLKEIMLPGYFTNLEERSRIQYNFKNTELLDSFWAHAIITLVECKSGDEHFYAYNPHDWFVLARRENEIRFMKLFKERQTLFLMTVGNKTPLDKLAGKDVEDNYGQYCMLDKPYFPKNNYYLNIIGDFLIEVYIDQRVADEIDKLYESTKKSTPQKLEELKKIIFIGGRNKLVVSRNKNKAERLRKGLKKNFYIPRENQV